MRLFDVSQRHLRRFDLWLALIVFGLSVFGVFLLWGAFGGETFVGYARRQLMWIALGGAILAACCFLDLKTVEVISYPLYALCLLLLVGLLFLGHGSGGAHAWYRFGRVQIQPSEFAKILTVIVLASHLSRFRSQLGRPAGLVVPALIVGVPALLTILQNDTGTALVFLPILLTMIYMAGVPKRILGALAIVALLAAVIALPRMHPYQLARISTVLGKRFSDPLMQAIGRNPEDIWRKAESASRWHSEQARIALGSGRLFGKGWGKGTQTSLALVPRFYTDSIYAPLGEQFGFVGCALLLAAYAFLAVRAARIALDARDMFSSLLVVGLLTIFAAHVLINLGMAVDLLPIIGLPLPFLSYGGSFLLTLFVLFGLILNVGMKKYLY
ncbi:MAG: FtsW/RodA/SpoVE family cell cycle protein [Candidatus Sumerlaeota bacterium]|nr:FtsW/RodA/SpoVE family cell cycle protein [Candidatus Sumerlaeota bacterium]